MIEKRPVIKKCPAGEKRPVTGKYWTCSITEVIEQLYSVKPVILVLACCFVWAFGACKNVPEKTGEYPAAELPPAQSDETSLESARGLHGQIVREGDEEATEASEVSPDGEALDKVPGEEASGTEAPDTEIAEQAGGEEPEIVLPEPVPLPDPRQITEIPQLAEVRPDPAPPATQAGDAPRPSPSARPETPPPSPPPPPPVPEFIRPSEPFSEESAEAVPPPPEPVFDLPARPNLPPDDDLAYSRIVTAYVGQYIEIPFRGPGWVYLGELGSRRGVYYDSRRIDDEGMVFVFRANEEGSYSLKFNRQDFIRDYVINDYVQVKVLPPPEITGSAWHSTAVVPDRIYAAPRWPPSDLSGAAPVPPEAAASATAAARPVPAIQPEAAPVTQPASVQPDSAQPAQPAAAGQAGPGETLPEAADPATAEEAALPDVYLAKAKEEYDAGHIAGALETLDRFRAAYPGGSDEAYWLYGQALEASGPNRDIRLALDYYRRLTREYPQSSRYDAARRRIAYLERFYFNIQ
ncbi:MAG: hypothetical protein LBG26_06395 [Treponema sp.]|nr:hypothetical protein [Treponema sp.]